MPSFVTRLIFRAASAVPAGLREFVYRRPRLLRPLARWLKHRTPQQDEIVVRLSAGPNRGAKFAVNRRVPNYFWLRGEYEPALRHALESHVRPGMVVVDVGAHVGFVTLHLARLVGPTGHVIAIEPDPGNYSLLRRNCELNHLAQVAFFFSAVSDRPGLVEFAADGTTTSHLARPNDPQVIKVPADTLDRLLAAAPHPVSVVKLDIEGAESAALRGSSRLLRDHRPLWIVEVHSWQNLLDCSSLLQDAGYRVRHLNPAFAEQGVTEASFDVCHVIAEPCEN